MFIKEKMYLIAGNADSSICGASAVYDILLFKSYLEFEKYVDAVPVVMDTLVLTSNELPFTNMNMMRLMKLVNSPFIQIKSGIVYLVDNSYDRKIIQKFLEEQQLNDWTVYQGDLSVKFITEILTGERRDAVEGQIDLVTYRMRASEYSRQEQLRKNEEEAAKYATDEDKLSGIPDIDVPNETIISEDRQCETTYIVGEDMMERTLLSFITAQYLALSGKTLIVEKDVEYHRLSDIVTKAGTPHFRVDVQDLMRNMPRCLDNIRKAKENLVVITHLNRSYYDYNFITDLLEVGLEDTLDYVVRECNFEEAPFGKPYTIVTRNTVPDILRCCNSIKYDIDVNLVNFVGVMLGSLGPVNLASAEMKAIISNVLEKDGIKATTAKMNGVKLCSKGGSYDILSIIGKADRG